MYENISEQKENTNELVSVVVPIYGVAQYLRQCLDSIVNQTYENLEIILVDDGSTDGSAQICDEYAVKDKRIKVIHKENGGLVSARKAGVALCTGSYIAYIDGDDWISVDYIKEFADIIRNYKPDVIICNCIREGKKRITERLNYEGLYDRKKLEDSVFPRILFNGEFYKFGIGPYIYKLYKAGLLKEYQNKVSNDIVVGEDAALFYPIALHSNSLFFLDKELYHYRFNYESLTLKFNDKLANSSYELNKHLRKELSNNFDMDRQVSYYHCLMALANAVNVARGGLSKNLKHRLYSLIEYYKKSDLQGSLNKCDFKHIRIPIYQRIGIFLMKKKMYKMMVFGYYIKFKLMGGIKQ